MDAYKLAEMNPADRRQLLEDTADKMEDTSYFKPLTPEEMDLKREELADNSIRLSELTDELKAVKDQFKGMMNPLINGNKKLLKEIKSRQEEVDGKLYYIANHDSGFMETWDEAGTLIGTRRLRPNEKQSTIFQISKTA